MKFTAIPDNELDLQQGTRVLFRGPEGSGFGDLETMHRTVDGLPLVAITARVELEADDLELLQAGHPIYITQYGGLIPMAVDIPATLDGQSARIVETDPDSCRPGRHVTPHRGCILR